MIHVITAVHNRYKITEHFVKALTMQTYSEGIHLILVDDGSTDGTADMVREIMPNATIITGDGNLWWGGALHEAYKWVKTNLASHPDEYLLISNDDVMYESDYIERAISVLQNHNNTMLLGLGCDVNTNQVSDMPYYYDFYNKRTVAAHEREAVDGIFYKGDHCSTRSLFMRVKDMLTIGGFHPILLPHYGSDYEWTYRGWKKGIDLIADRTVTYRYDKDTTGDNFYSTLTLKKVFSKRSMTNPIYKFNYHCLTVPLRYLPRELGRQLGRYVKKIGIIREIVRRK